MGVVEDVRGVLQDLVTPHLAALKQKVDDLEKRIDERFAAAEKRSNERFAAMEKRSDEGFAASNRRLDDLREHLDRRFDHLEAQQNLFNRVSELERKLQSLEHVQRPS